MSSQLKALNKQQKSKGLLKLKNYCTVCEKEFRDANGLSNHERSEGHMYRMNLFAANPLQFTAKASNRFQSEFMEMVRRRYRTDKWLAMTVYNEFISDRHHTHMKATRWVTLTDFVKHLGREGLCRVEQGEDSCWYITYLAADPEMRRRQEERERGEVISNQDEVVQDEILKAQRKRALDRAASLGQAVERSSATSVDRSAALGLKVRLGSGDSGSSKTSCVAVSLSQLASSSTTDGGSGVPRRRRGDSHMSSGSGGGGMDDVMSFLGERKRKVEKVRREEKEAEEERLGRLSVGSQPQSKRTPTVKSSADRPWLQGGIIVKILNKKLRNGAYYKEKAVVRSVEGFAGVVKVRSSGKKLRLDQDELETVIPREGGRVLILEGPHRSREAIMRRLRESKFSAELELRGSGSGRGDVVCIPYEHFSRLDVD